MDLIPFKQFSRKHFLQIYFKTALENARNTHISTRLGLLAADSGPPTPLVSVTERRSTNVLPAARRTRGCPWLGRRTAGAPLLACMAALRRCSPWPRHSDGVEHSRSANRACSRHPEHDAVDGIYTMFSTIITVNIRLILGENNQTK